MTKEMMTDEQIKALADELLDTQNNVYEVAQNMFGAEVTDETFERLRSFGNVFKCDTCDTWKDVDDAFDDTVDDITDLCKECAEE